MKILWLEVKDLMKRFSMIDNYCKLKKFIFLIFFIFYVFLKDCDMFEINYLYFVK